MQFGKFINCSLVFLFLLILIPYPGFADTNSSDPSFTGKAYKLSAGDKIRIEVFGEEDMTKEVILGDAGKISYPFLGEIDIKGMSLKQLEAHITDKLNGPFLIDPKVSVSIITYRPFFINGQVSKPGGYAFQPGLTLRKAIAIAGGVTEQAFLEESSVIRETDESKTSQKLDMDTPIFPGDIINVSEYQQVFINGEVKKPGAYPYQKELTYRKAIALAGGFSDRANKEKVFVVQQIENDKTTKSVELEDIVLPGDIITVKQSFF